MDIKILLIFAIIFSVSNSVPRIKQSTYRYILLNILFLDNMESYIKKDPIKFADCYKIIRSDYRNALQNFTDSMKNVSAHIYKKYPNFKADEKRASYGSVVILVDIGEKMLKFEKKVWDSILLGNYDIIGLVNHYTHAVRHDIGEVYDSFLKKIKLLESRRFEREEAVKNDIAQYRDPVLNKLKVVAKYLKFCATGIIPVMEIPEDNNEDEDNSEFWE